MRYVLGSKECQLVRPMQFQFLACTHARPKPHSAPALSVEKQATGRACQAASCPVVQLFPEAESNRDESLQITGQEDDFQAQDPRYHCCGIRGHLQEAAASSQHRIFLLLPSSSPPPSSLSGSCRHGGTKGNPL